MTERVPPAWERACARPRFEFVNRIEEGQIFEILEAFIQ